MRASEHRKEDHGAMEIRPKLASRLASVMGCFFMLTLTIVLSFAGIPNSTELFFIGSVAVSGFLVLRSLGAVVCLTDRLAVRSMGRTTTIPRGNILNITEGNAPTITWRDELARTRVTKLSMFNTPSQYTWPSVRRHNRKCVATLRRWSGVSRAV
jgi:hypothetical protein